MRSFLRWTLDIWTQTGGTLEEDWTFRELHQEDVIPRKKYDGDIL